MAYTSKMSHKGTKGMTYKKKGMSYKKKGTKGKMGKKSIFSSATYGK